MVELKNMRVVSYTITNRLCNHFNMIALKEATEFQAALRKTAGELAEAMNAEAVLQNLLDTPIDCTLVSPRGQGADPISVINDCKV